MDKGIPKSMEQHSGDVFELDSREIVLEPNLFGRENHFRKFCRRFAKCLCSAGPDGRRDLIEAMRDEVQGLAVVPAPKDLVALQFACSVLIDIVAQGWELLPGTRRITIQSPRFSGQSPEEITKCVSIAAVNVLLTFEDFRAYPQIFLVVASNHPQA